MSKRQEKCRSALVVISLGPSLMLNMIVPQGHEDGAVAFETRAKADHPDNVSLFDARLHPQRICCPWALVQRATLSLLLWMSSLAASEEPRSSLWALFTIFHGEVIPPLLHMSGREGATLASMFART